MDVANRLSGSYQFDIRINNVPVNKREAHWERRHMWWHRSVGRGEWTVCPLPLNSRIHSHVSIPAAAHMTSIGNLQMPSYKVCTWGKICHLCMWWGMKSSFGGLAVELHHVLKRACSHSHPQSILYDASLRKTFVCFLVVNKCKSYSIIYCINWSLLIYNANEILAVV